MVIKIFLTIRAFLTLSAKPIPSINLKKTKKRYSNLKSVFIHGEFVVIKPIHDLNEASNIFD